MEATVQVAEATISAYALSVSQLSISSGNDSHFGLSMTLGHVYDLDLKRNEQPIKEVIIQAQGEMALEEYIKQVKEIWTNYALDLVNYQNKCRLIRYVFHEDS